MNGMGIRKPKSARLGLVCTISGGQHAGLKVALAFLNGLLDVERADDAIFGGADRQVDERGAAGGERKFAFFGGAFLALGAPGRGAIGVTAKAAVPHHAHVGQKGGQGAGGGGFGRAAFAANEHTAQARVDRVQNQGALHAFLPDDGSEGENWGHINSGCCSER